MTLIKSISGIRGTIGGMAGEGLTPLDIVKFSAAFGEWVRQKEQQSSDIRVVIGRDARISGPLVESLVVATLTGMGIDVINIGMATTPTVEIAVINENAHGGIIMTASHNPKEWNALKLLNNKGEFLSGADGEQLLVLAEDSSFTFAGVEKLGEHVKMDNYTDLHIQQICKLEAVDVKAISEANFKIVVDAVNSVGGIAVPKLLEALGVRQISVINGTPDGIFAHNPEPLPEHLTEISSVIVKEKADMGFVVDPDVDRLAIVCEDGSMFGEEYTLVAVADYVLSMKKGSVVSNLSSSRALKDLTISHGCEYYASAVGEVNVVAKMKEVQAVIGGEGNGGVILPAYHYGRDALVGIALFLTYLAKQEKISCSDLKKKYPKYNMSKNKITLSPDVCIEKIFEKIRDVYASESVTDIDGIKIDFADAWVHLRKSNTEPIIRIYTEATSVKEADALAKKTMQTIKEIAET